ncbi:type II secretion system F family protein [Candidatus Sumerlaeota bacterium]|nr:type II secretion system F family protein [Candidatus Sumerlaeota bacterium]
MIGLFNSVPRRIEDIALLTRHISGAMKARAPMHEILRSYVADCEPGKMTRVVNEMAGDVEAGTSLADALDKHILTFPASFRRLVRVGEQSRTLEGTLEQLAVSLEEGLKSYEFFRRVAIYPLFVTILIWLDVMFILIYILPKFDDIFSGLGAQLPYMTELWLGLNHSNVVPIIFTLLMLIPIAMLTGTALGLRFRLTGSGRFMLQLPFAGVVLRRMETARFTKNLALLLDVNLPLSEALGLLVDSTDNAYVQSAIRDLQRRYESGEKLGGLIAGQPLFPAGMAVIIASAEDRGGLAQALHGLSKFYQERTAHGLAVIREIFEPVLLVLVGLMIAMLLLAMYLPLFTLPGLIPSS